MITTVPLLRIGLAGLVAFFAIQSLRRARRDNPKPPQQNPFGLPQKEYRATMDRIRSLSKSNPAEAERIAREAFGPAIARNQNERADLWARAPKDPAAAQRLHDLLQEELETDQYALKERKDASPAERAEIQRSIEEGQQALAKVRPWLQGS